MKKTETAEMVSRALKGRRLKIYMLRAAVEHGYSRGMVFLVVETSRQKAISRLAHAMANDSRLKCVSGQTKLSCECLGLAKDSLPPGLIESALDSLLYDL